MTYKKQLPFSKPLRELQAKGLVPTNDVMIIIGNHAWRKAKNLSISFPERVLALPPWNNPLDYYFPVQNCSTMIVDTGFVNDDYLTDLARCLYEHDATKVFFISHDDKFSIIYKE
jgi:hypothetical protein